MILRSIWRIFDLAAVALATTFMTLFVPFCLVAEIAVMLTVPAQTKMLNLLPFITSLLASLGGFFGTVALCITATVSITKIRLNKTLKNIVLVGLIAGILSASYVITLDYYRYLFAYMIMSAIAHLLDLLWLRERKVD